MDEVRTLNREERRADERGGFVTTDPSQRPPCPLAGWTRLPVVLAGVLTFAYVVWIAIGGSDFTGGYAVSQILYLPVGFSAVALAGLVAWSRRHEARDLVAWTLLAASLAAFWIADVVFVVEEVAHGSVESPAWSDVGYLVYYPLLLIALLLLSARSRAGGDRLRVGLDMGTVFLGGGVLVWYFVLRPAFEGIGSGLGAAITIAYPLGDLLLVIGIASLAVHRSRMRGRASLVFMLGAVVTGFVADLAYGYTSFLDGFDGGGAIDAIYLVSWFLFAAAAAGEYSSGTGRTVPRADPNPEVEPHDKIAVLSYFAVAVAISVLVWALRGSFGTAEGGAAVVAVLVTVLAMIRQVVAVRENARLREQRAVKESEERFQDTLRRTQFSIDHASESILWFDPDGRVVDANLSACRMLEYSREELIGRSIGEIDPEFEDGADRWDWHWRTLLQQRSRVFDAQHRSRSGRVFPVEVTVNYLQYGGQEFSCSFARDISERKRAEENLREAEAQLRQSQKMDAVGQLAGGIAHDFNNLLTAILGYCELILAQGDRLDEDLRADVGEVKGAADRAAALTRQILAFSRRQPLEPRIAGLNDIVTSTSRLLARTLGEHIDLVTRLDPQAGLVEVDSTQFEQVVMNLAVNARDAMPHGGMLTIETGQVDITEDYCLCHPGVQPGRHAMLAVSDTGVGMDEQTMSHAFEPFFTTKEEGRGTGLGLATVYGIVKQSGGDIFIYSEPGEGTTIKIYLPRAGNDSERAMGLQRGDAGRSGAMPLDTLDSAPARQKTILLVEDEEGLRDLVNRVLESRGYEVRHTAVAEEALAIIAENEDVDLLLTDVVLPGAMHGGELARRVRGLRPELPVLFMSGYTLEAAVRAGKIETEADYLEKPFTPDALLRRVGAALTGADTGGGVGVAERSTSE